jgi:tetratricopeptide (TPR) repeat protein
MRTASIYLKTFFSALLMIFFAAAPISACIWFYGTDIEGKPVKFMEYGPADYVKFLTDHSHERFDFEKEPPPPDAPPNDSFRAQSDYAASLVLKGEYVKAIEIFEGIEKAHPNEYVIAANLGTAYELSGDNEKALKWISEGIRRNPQSHYGTEWLHVRILEAKLALAKDPDWLKTHSVLGLNFENELRPKMPWQLPEGQNLESVQTALEYQLHERLEFVKPPEPIVGELLADLGNILSLNRSLEHAIAVYDVALKFNPVHADLISKRRTFMQGLVLPDPSPDSGHARLKYGLIIFSVGLCVSVVVIYVLRWLQRGRRA